MTPALALAAARTFRARQSIASRMIAERARAQVAEGDSATKGWTRDQAEAKLRPWLAVAALAGADLPELYEDATVIFPPASSSGAVGNKSAQSGDIRRLRVSASAISPHPVALAELTKARDAALDALAWDATEAPQATADIVVLAIALGCPPYRPGTSGPQGRKAERPPELMRGKPSEADASRPAPEGAEKEIA